MDNSIDYSQYFTDKASKVHEGKYTYDHVDYVNSKTQVLVTCPEHGDFLQRPSDHLQGKGCNACAINYRGRKIADTTSSFTAKAAKTHSGAYIYSEVVYIASNQKVTIICKTHGSFFQTPNDHLRGAGCPFCAEVRRRKKYYDEPTILYYVYFKNINKYKIGITMERIGVSRRLAYIGEQFTTIHTTLFDNGRLAYTKEQELLIKYNKLLYTGPPLLKDGNSELFIKDIHEEW